MFNFSQDEEDVYPLFSEYIPSEIGIGLAGVIPGYIGRLAGAQIGVYPLTNIVISAVPTTRADDYFLNERDGLIGGEVLSRFHIWYNFPLSKIYIKPARGWDKPFNYDRSGIIWMSKRDEKGDAVVRQVIINSPAYISGIQGGDVVSTINGKPVKDISNADLSLMLRSSSKKTYTFQIYRSGESLKYRLKLKDYF
jgi:membrane-associated protease RseP (regulator of RpoE activity)